MDEGIKCMCRKLEAICLEADSMLRKEIQEFFDAVIKDALPSSSSETDRAHHKPLVAAKVVDQENSNKDLSRKNLVNSSLIQSLPSEADRFRFHKSVSSSNLRMRKRPSRNYRKDEDFGFKGNSLEQSFLRIEHESQEQEFSDSDWEIV